MLLLLDGGCARMWSHDRPPSLPEWSEIASVANNAVDLAVRGRDAAAAGAAFARQGHPLYLYDIPRDSLDDVRQSFAELVRARRFDASLEPLVERIPHRKRIDLALQHGGGAGIVQFHGLWAAVVGGVPPDRALPVLGERMPDGPDEGRWRRVSIELRTGIVARTVKIGHVLVDEARLMAVDAEAIGAWDDSNPVDGKAAVVFWGRDAATAAAEIGATTISPAGEGDHFGWADLPLKEALTRLETVEAARKGERKFAVDFRPHTHHWQVMREVRATTAESGVLDLGGARLCMFMTSWGDGAFAVEAELDGEGRMLRLRIELGDEEIVQRQRDVEELWHGAFAKRAIVSARVARDGEAVGYLCREAADNEEDSGWSVYAGDENDEYVDDPANAVLMPLRDLLRRDAALKDILRTSAPCAFERKDAKAPFRRVEER